MLPGILEDNMAKSKPISAVRKEYNKQRRRIQRYIRAQEKAGVVFTNPILPEIPKRITAGSVRRLMAIKTAKIYEKGGAVFAPTGESVTKRSQVTRLRKERYGRIPLSEIPDVFSGDHLKVKEFEESLGDLPGDLGGLAMSMYLGLRRDLLAELGSKQAVDTAIATALDAMPYTIIDALHSAGAGESGKAIREFMERVAEYLPGGDDPVTRAAYEDAMESYSWESYD